MKKTLLLTILLLGTAFVAVAPTAEAKQNPPPPPVPILRICTEETQPQSCPGTVCFARGWGDWVCPTDAVEISKDWCVQGEPACGDHLACHFGMGWCLVHPCDRTSTGCDPCVKPVCGPSPCDFGCEPAAAKPIPVGVCVEDVTAERCFRDGDVCVAAFSWVPQCVEAACYPASDCIDIRDPCEWLCTDPCSLSCEPTAQQPPTCIRECGPVVGVCVARVTAPSCYRGADACVGFSYQVPACVDAACWPDARECVDIRDPCDWLCTSPCDFGCEPAGPGVRPPPMDCYDIYREYRVGPVTVIQRSSCHAEVRVDGLQ